MQIALEPESASLYCESLQYHENANDADRFVSSVFQARKRYLLADLGGETTDVAVYEVFGCGLMKELYCSVDGARGGTYVNKNYVKLLEQIFGKDVIDEYRATYPGDWVYAISKYFRGALILNHPEVAKLFDPVLTNISDHLKRVFAMFDSIDCLILVGGFAECRLLQLFLRREFEEAGGVQVIVPRQCSLAVAKGAVLLGHWQTLAGVSTFALSKSSFKKDFTVGYIAYGSVLIAALPRICTQKIKDGH